MVQNTYLNHLFPLSIWRMIVMANIFHYTTISNMNPCSAPVLFDQLAVVKEVVIESRLLFKVVDKTA